MYLMFLSQAQPSTKIILFPLMYCVQLCLSVAIHKLSWYCGTLTNTTLLRHNLLGELLLLSNLKVVVKVKYELSEAHSYYSL